MIEQASPLSAGSVLIKSDLPLPTWFRFHCEDYGEWKKLFDADGQGVERTALAVGWHFSYIAMAVKCAALGLTRRSATQRATSKLLKMFGVCGFNAFEITELVTPRWVGLYHATVVAHPRPFHRTPFLQDPIPYHSLHHMEDIEGIFWRAAEVEPQLKGI